MPYPVLPEANSYLPEACIFCFSPVSIQPEPDKKINTNEAQTTNKEHFL